MVARSKEAKALGIKMGVPAHHIKNEIRRYGIRVFSSNYTLYGDMSQRVMTTLEAMAPRVDVYSIDEAFLDLTGVERMVALDTFGQTVRDTVHRHVGLPVCVGIAPTRTLAKLANYAAKKYPATEGVVDLTDAARQRRLMARVPVDEIWGVGRKLSVKLRAMGIQTALELADTDLATLRKRFSVVLERTARELNGVACLPWEDAPAPKQQIMCSRSFGQPLRSLADLEEAVGHHATRTMEKLRAGHQYAWELTVFIRTNPFKSDAPQYSRSASIRLIQATQDSRVVVKESIGLLRKLYQEGFDYAKAGVLLSGLVDKTGLQSDFFQSATDPSPHSKQSERLMAVIDQVNRTSKTKLVIARNAGAAAYSMRREHLSPAYTTDWNSLPLV